MKYDKAVAMRCSQNTFDKIEVMADSLQQPISATARMIIELFFHQGKEEMEYIKKHMMVGGV